MCEFLATLDYLFKKIKTKNSHIFLEYTTKMGNMTEIRHEQQNEQFPKCHDRLKCQCSDCEKFRVKTLKLINSKKLGLRDKNEKTLPLQYRSDLNILFNLDH